MGEFSQAEKIWYPGNQHPCHSENFDPDRNLQSFQTEPAIEDIVDTPQQSRRVARSAIVYAAAILAGILIGKVLRSSDSYEPPNLCDTITPQQLVGDLGGIYSSAVTISYCAEAPTAGDSDSARFILTGKNVNTSIIIERIPATALSADISHTKRNYIVGSRTVTTSLNTDSPSNPRAIASGIDGSMFEASIINNGTANFSPGQIRNLGFADCTIVATIFGNFYGVSG